MLTEQRKGIAFALGAPLFYALKSAAIKYAPPANIEFFVFLRFVFDFLLLLSFFLIHWKKLSTTDHPIAILFYFNLFSGLISLIPCAFAWQGVSTITSWWPFVLISVFGVLSKGREKTQSFRAEMNRAS